MDEENNAPSIKSPDEITIEEKTYEEKANPDAQTQESNAETSTPDIVSPAPKFNLV